MCVRHSFLPVDLVLPDGLQHVLLLVELGVDVGGPGGPHLLDDHAPEGEERDAGVELVLADDNLLAEQERAEGEHERIGAWKAKGGKRQSVRQKKV